MSSFLLCLKTFWALFYKEVVVFKSDYLRVVINGLFWFGAVLIPPMFFLTQMGLPDNYCQIIVPAGIASWGMFDIISNATSFISDILGDRVIEHELILPLPQWAVFIKIALANAYRSFAASIFMIPIGVGVVYLGTGFAFPQINLIKTLMMLFVANVFYGFLGLFGASFMQKIADVRNVWMRVLFPLWYVGGFLTGWFVMDKASPTFAKVMLLNPVMYISEGMRSAMLGQQGYLNYWYCIGAILLSTILVGTVAVIRFQKRLDCI
jgi:ABC-2 type transport system permease protein